MDTFAVKQLRSGDPHFVVVERKSVTIYLKGSADAAHAQMVAEFLSTHVDEIEAFSVEEA